MKRFIVGTGLSTAGYYFGSYLCSDPRSAALLLVLCLSLYALGRYAIACYQASGQQQARRLPPRGGRRNGRPKG